MTLRVSVHSLVLILLLIVGYMSCDQADFDALSTGTVTLSPTVTFIGTEFQVKKNQKGYVYQGIKYGTATRFEHSQVNSDYSYQSNPGQPIAGFTCPHIIDPLLEHELILNEDCLYLDVTVPPIGNLQRAFPVLLWVHGGSFPLGDKNFYNATSLAADERMIVVTINYRLENFGYLSSVTGDLAGNWALGDVKSAFQWVRQNIGFFGGNPGKVTLSGQGLGGALVSAAFLDESIREHLLAGIAMSGSVLADWADDTESAPEYFLYRSSSLGCSNLTIADRVDCLKQVPYEHFLTEPIPPVGLDYVQGLVIDGTHIPGNPLELIPNQADTDAVFVSGYLRDDASFFLFLAFPTMFFPGVLNFGLVPVIISLIVPKISACPQQFGSLLSDIISFYNIQPTDDENTLRQKLILVAADASYGYPSLKENIAYASRSFSNEVRNYQYLVTHDPGFIGLGVFHLLDVTLLFRGIWEEHMMEHNVFLNEKATDAFRKLVRQIVYEGKPDYDFVPFGSDGNYNILNQRGRWVQSTNEISGTIQLWDQISAFQCTV